MRYLPLLLLLVGCQPSYLELQARRDELERRQAELAQEVYVLREFTSHDYDRMQLVVHDVSRVTQGEEHEAVLDRKLKELQAVSQKIESLTAELQAIQ